MPKPYPVRIVVKVLRAKGFVLVAQTGSHAKYRKIGNPTLTAIVPIHAKETRYGTFRSVLRQAKLREDDFRKSGK